MGLRISSWYLRAFKLPLAVAYDCLYSNPTATMGQSAHNKPFARGSQKVSFCPLKAVTTPNGSQVKTLVRVTSTQMSFPETVSAKIIWLCKPTVSSAVWVAGLRKCCK